MRLRSFITILPLALGTLNVAAATRPEITTISRLQQALNAPADFGRPFSVTGTVLFCCSPRHGSWTISIADEGAGRTTLHGYGREKVAAVRLCDVIVAHGKINRFYDGNQRQYADCSTLEILSNRTELISRPISANEFFDDANYLTVVRLRGIVRDGFHDESAPDWLYLSVSCERRFINATVFADTEPPVDLCAILGKEVELVGEITKSTVTPRKHA